MVQKSITNGYPVGPWHFGGVLGRLGGILEPLGASWSRLRASWGRLGGVLEGLGGVLKAKMRQDSAKIASRTAQEQNPRELPSGLSPPSRRSEVQRAAVMRGLRW